MAYINVLRHAIMSSLPTRIRVSLGESVTGCTGMRGAAKVASRSGNIGVSGPPMAVMPG